MTDDSIVEYSDLKAKVAEDRLQREKTCGEQVTMLLQEYECTIVANPVITSDGRIVVTVTIRSTT